MEEEFPFGFEDLWRQMGETGWTCEARGDSTVRIVAEGAEMTYAVVPADDPEAFALVALSGAVEGREDEGAVCEDALRENAAGDGIARSLAADGRLKLVLRGDARRNFTAERLHESVRALAAATGRWNARLNGGAV